jgi:hypothetical protein
VTIDDRSGEGDLAGDELVDLGGPALVSDLRELALRRP